MRTNHERFTLLELIVVMLVIGILVGLAVPRLNAVKDRASLSSVKADVHNAELAEEAYYSDYRTYGTLTQIQASKQFALSPGNSAAITSAADGFAITVTNSAVATGVNQCTVRVGSGAASTVDGTMTCP